MNQNSYSVVFQQLQDAQNVDRYRVMALTGAWGTGKTYLWRELQKGLVADSSKPNKPISVSSFGAQNVDELRFRILEQAISKGEPGLKETLTKLVHRITPTLIAAHWSGRFIDVAASFGLPSAVANRLVVIDDLERRGEAFSLRALLGFVDLLVEQYSARVLLILNEEEIRKDPVWGIFRERVVNRVLVLDPTPAEAFAVAITQCAAHYQEEIRRAVEALKINNIRTIVRILDCATALLGKAAEVPVESRSHVIPTIVLFTALHYHGIPGAPQLERVRSFDVSDYIAREFIRGNKKGGANEDPVDVQIRNLLESVGIVTFDEFDNEVYRFLTMGSVDEGAVARILSGYAANQRREAVDGCIREIAWDLEWDQNRTANELIDRAKPLLTEIPILDASRVSALYRLLLQLGATDLGEEFITGWIKHFEETTPPIDDGRDSFVRDVERSYEPRIAAVIQDARRRQFKLPSALEAMETIAMAKGWGDKERQALLAATTDEVFVAMPKLGREALRRVMKEVLDWLAAGDQLQEELKHGVAVFIDACSKICNEKSGTRLAEIIQREFAARGRGDLLQRQPRDDANQSHT